MSPVRVYSRKTIEVTMLLGKQIRFARKSRGWTEAELAERSGISLSTIKRIEGGDLTCGVGLIFEAANVSGVVLFSESASSIQSLHERIDDKIVLLPKTIKNTPKKVDDDF